MLRRIAVAATLAMLLAVAPAHADRAFAPRYSTNDAGDITFIANTLLSCPTANAQCATARDGTNGTVTNLNNNAYTMAYVDVDSDATTFNSSTADLVTPAGSTVLFAGLYFGADAPGVSEATRRTVKLRVPGAAAYEDLTASVYDASTNPNNLGRYQGFVDVTQRVRAAGDGPYAVANVQAGLAADRFAGWTLVVAYRDATQPPRNLTVFDGLTTIVSNAPPTSIPVSGFTTPPSGVVGTSVGFIAYEGDLGLLGDSASLLTSQGSFTLTNAQNPATNYFNSSISQLGSRFSAKNPDYVNQLGFDADLFNADGFLGNQDTSATIRVTTQQDQYLPGVVTFSTELYAPNVTPAKTVANLSNPSGPNRPGDTLRYTITFTNSGQDEANDFVLRDPIPGNATYVPDSLRIVGGPNAPASPTDAVGDDLGEYDAAGDLVRFRLGTGATATAGGSLGDGASATNSVSVTFEVTIDDISAGSQIVNTALANYTGNTLGIPFVDQVTPEVTTVVERPDLTLAKSHTGSFTAGDTVTFRLTASNVGSASTDGTVTVTDTFPASAFSAIHDAGGAGWSCTISGLTLTCTRSDALPAGDSYPTIVVDADVADPAPTDVTNTASISGGGEQNTSNNTATDTGPGNTQADVSLTKVASPATVASGDTITYTLVARNNGPSTATAVEVTDTLPAAEYANVVATPTQGTCTTAVVCTLGSIARNREVTITISATVLGNDTTLTNTAIVSSPTPDPVPINNEVTADVEVLNTAQVSITKTGAPAEPQVGAAFTYTLAVANDGPGTATGLTVTDDLPDALEGPVVVAPGWSCNAPATGGTLTCTRPTLADGASSAITVSGTIAASAGGAFFTNGAAVSATSADPDSSNNTDSTTNLAAPASDLEVTKQFSTDARVNTGAQVSFILRAVNNGPSDATGVVISDPLPAGLTFVSSSNGACNGVVTCTVGSLAAGAVFTATITVNVTAPGSASIVNVASVDGDQSDPIPSNDAGQDTLIVNAAADVSVTKTAPPTATVGDDIGYTLRAFNNGPDAAADVAISDSLPAGTTFVSAPGCTFAAPVVTCAIGTLASGASATRTITVTVSPALAGQSLVNTATASTSTFDPDATNDADDASVVVDALADLSIVKTASVANPRVGQDVTYTLAITNDGPNDATGVIVTDTLPPGVDLIRMDPGCLEAAGVVTCDVGDVAAGATVTVSITVQTTLASAGQTATNAATVDGNETDPDPVDNSTTVDVTVQEQIDLRLTKTVSNPAPAADSDFSYRLSVFNNGPSDATGVVIADPLPTGVNFVSGPAGCTVAARVVTCTIGALAAGDTAVRTITVHATPAAAGQSLTNGATVTGAEPEVNPSNNQDAVDVVVGPLVDLTVTKTADDTTPVVGARITYLLTVANAGPSRATAVTLTDTLPAGLAFVSATPTQGTCTGAVVCSLGTIPAASAVQILIVATVTAGAGTPIANTVTVTSPEPDSTPGDNTTTTTVTPDAGPTGPGPGPGPGPDGGAAPELHIDKVVDRERAAVGDVLHYDITVENRGDAPAHEVRVTDTFTGSVNVLRARPTAGSCTQRQPVVCELGTIAAETRVVIRLDARITGTGALTNTVTLQTAEGVPTGSGDQEIATTNVSQGAARLSVRKRASKPVVASGGLVRYRIKVTNRGPSTALRVRVCDRVPVGLSFFSAPGAVFRNGQACWSIPRLADGASRSFTVVVRAQRTASGRTVRNVANARARNARRARAGADTRVLPAPVRPGGVTG